MTSSPIDVIVVNESPQERGLIKQALSMARDAKMSFQLMAETDSLLYGYELIRQNHPLLAIINIGSEPTKCLEIIQKIATYLDHVFIILTGPVVNMEDLKVCMQAGARDYIAQPLELQQLVEVFHRNHPALESLQTTRLGSRLTGDSTGRIITLFSNKGGLGKTTIAVNLALELSAVINKPVVLVDLNLDLGDITTFLDLTPKQTIVDIARNIARVDAAYLENSLAEFRHGNGRVYVLADPMFAEEAEEITPEQIQTVLTVLRSVFDYVIVDTNNSFDAKTLTSLDLANNILLVSMLNLPTIRSTQRTLHLFDRLGYDRKKVHVVVNRYLPDKEVPLEDVEEALKHPIYWKIPNNYPLIISAINRGVPLAEVENSKDLVDYFTQLAFRLSGRLPKGSHHKVIMQPENDEPPTNEENIPAKKGFLANLLSKK